jgi:hypothetical protein
MTSHILDINGVGPLCRGPKSADDLGYWFMPAPGVSTVDYRERQYEICPECMAIGLRVETAGPVAPQEIYRMHLALAQRPCKITNLVVWPQALEGFAISDFKIGGQRQFTTRDLIAAQIFATGYVTRMYFDTLQPNQQLQLDVINLLDAPKRFVATLCEAGRPFYPGMGPA